MPAHRVLSRPAVDGLVARVRPGDLLGALLVARVAAARVRAPCRPALPTHGGTATVGARQGRARQAEVSA